MNATPRRTVRVPDDEWDAALEVAARRGENFAAVLRAMVRAYAVDADRVIECLDM